MRSLRVAAVGGATTNSPTWVSPPARTRLARGGFEWRRSVLVLPPRWRVLREMILNLGVQPKSRVSLPNLFAIHPDHANVGDADVGALSRHELRENEEAEKLLHLTKENAKKLENFSAGEVLESRSVLSNLIMAGEDIEKRIEEYASQGKINNVLLCVIQNRLELAKQDKATEAIKCLDLLHRRIKVELESVSASPSMRLLNRLLNLKQSENKNSWLREAKDVMLASFIPDQHSMFIPTLLEEDGEEEKGNTLLRFDFIREVDDLLDEVMSTLPQPEALVATDLDTVALKLQVIEKRKLLEDVAALRDLAIILKW